MKPILINLDLKNNSYEEIELKQGCQDTLIATITDLGDNVDLTGQVIAVEMLKADETFIIQTNYITVSANKITVILNKDLTRVSGKGKLQIKMTKDNIISGSWVVSAKIKKSAIDNAIGESGNIVTIKEELDKSIVKATEENKKTQDLIATGGAATKGQVAELGSDLADIENKKINISNLRNKVIQKLSKKESITIVCEGDSLTYGQDENSVDKRLPPIEKTDDGKSHSFKRAGKTYPEALKEYLDIVYPTSNHIVINKGFSGSWVDASWTTWGKNSNADISFIMLGSNDSNLNAGWVPTYVKGNIEIYLNDMRKIIDRYIKWGTLPVLLSPPRSLIQESGTNNRIAETFRKSLFTLSQEYNIPFFDVEEMMSGWGTTFYSDDTHLNTKGYSALGARLCGVLIGYTLTQDGQADLLRGETLGVRYTRDNFIGNNVVFNTNPNSFGTTESGSGLLCEIKKGDLNYSFYTKEDNIVLIPCYSNANGQSIKLSLNFNTQQGDTVLLNEVTSNIKGFTPPSQIITSANSSNLGTYNEVVKNAYNNSIYLQISNKGYHSLRVEQNEKITDGSFINGFIIMGYKEFINMADETLKIKQKTVLHKLTHSNYTPTPIDVLNIDVLISEMNEVFVGNKIRGDEQYTELLMKITMVEVDKIITEHIFTWHDNGSGNLYGGFFTKQINTINISTSPSNQRTITSISYDKPNKKYVINFGGNLKALCSLTISIY